jgi:hypothetical protein
MIVYPEPRTDKNGHYELVFRTGYVQVRVTKSLKKPDLRIVRIVEVKDRQRTTQDFELEARWHSAEVAVNSFNDGIGSILASAKEKPPLMSIASGVPTTGGYSSHVTLPGADYCGIMMPGLPDGTVKWPAFVCQATYDSHERALEDYNLLVKLVAGATGFTPTPSKLSTIFGGDGLIVGDSLTVSISEKEVVDLTYTTAGRSDVLHVP